MDESKKPITGFPAGTLVFTSNGYADIASVSVGDLVLTHKGRFRKVTAIESGDAKTCILTGNAQIETAVDTQILSLCTGLSENRLDVQTEIKRSADFKNHWWATPSEITDYPMSIVFDFKAPSPTRYNNILTHPKFWNLAGAQLGENTPIDLLSDNPVFSNARCFMEWYHKAFGTKTRQRHIPVFLMTLCAEYRQAFIDGFMSRNGGTQYGSNCYRYQSANKALIYELRYLVESLGYNTHVCFIDRPETTNILGRTVNQKPRYSISISSNPDRYRGVKHYNHTWYKCLKLSLTEKTKTVYSLTVEEDNSYVADSIVICNDS